MHVEVLWPQQSEPSSASFHNEALPPSKRATGRHTACFTAACGPAGGALRALLGLPNAQSPQCACVLIRISCTLSQPQAAGLTIKGGRDI